MKNRTAVIGYVLAALVVVTAMIVTVTVAGSRGEQGTDEHVHLDPVADPHTAAVDIMAGIHTWTPATQESPWDAMHLLADRFTGRMALAAASRPDPDPIPRQWAAWARGGDRIVGTASLLADQPVAADEDDEVQVRVTVRQVVMHSTGDTTPRPETSIRVHMVRTDEHTWKAEYFQALPLIQHNH